MVDTHIHVLPKALCDQLAAGEVLERASSAIKELVENSLDAGANEIEIEIEEAGRKRLSVTDNGCGMSMEDAKLSVLRHATSKIHSTDDLSAILTMGFRGEALASMAAVARLSMTTQQKNAQIGTYLHIEGAEMTECRECAAPCGTQIVLEDLFFNTPARLKFLKSQATETRRVCEVVEQFSLACPEVHWKLSIDGRIKCDYPKHKTLKERALAVFGRTLYNNLYPIPFSTLADISIDGLFCAPDYSQTNSGRLYTYVNRRIVRDKTINSAITQAYKEFLHGRQPCVILFLTIAPDQIDVNVHPTKHEIRFQSPDAVFRAVYRAIRSALEKTPWIASNHTLTDDEIDAIPESAFRTPEENARRNMGLPDPAFSKTADSDNAVQTAQPLPYSQNNGTCERELSVFDAPPLTPSIPLKLAPCPYQREFGFEKNTAPQTQENPEESNSINPNHPFCYFSKLQYIGQHDLTYLICSDGRDLVIIDQHAAHERINFERLKRVADAILPSQAQLLMFPVLINLDMRLAALLEEYRTFFESLGFQFDEMGAYSYAIRAVPDCLLQYDYAQLIRDALIDLSETGNAQQFDDIRDNILATMACHKSIRAGQKLSPAEAAELFRQMDETGFRSNCPHGRPVHFILSHAELEKRFLRTGFPSH